MRDKHQKPVDIFKKCMLRSAKPCAPRSRKPQLYGDTLRADASHLHGF